VATANSVLLSSAVEDYLKAVYALEGEGERRHIRTRRANRVSAPSVTAMMKRLAALGLSSGLRTVVSSSRTADA